LNFGLEMAGKRPVNPEGSDFLAELRRFHEQCGSPSYHRLAALSNELPALYEDRDLPALSVSAISEILAGRRVKPPTPGWVSSFVLCCQRQAWKIGRLTEDPGLASLPGWQERLQAARGVTEASEASEAATRAEGAGDRDAVEATGETGAPDTLGTPGMGGPGDVSRAPARRPLARAEHAYVAEQGPYGQALLSGLESEDPEAAYRVAVVLAAVPEHRDAAVALLVKPGTSRHLLALELLEAEAGRFEEAVADHACALARAAEDDGSLAGAIMFYEAAALCRSRTGLVALTALLLDERGRQRSAARIRTMNSFGKGAVRRATPHGPDGFPTSS
jgi:hypothetical protein